MKKVLELGSGTFPYKGLKNEKVIHTDIQRLPGIDKVFDAEKKIPFASNSFDKVVAFHFLEHVHDLNKVMEEVYRILKPGGLFYIHVPFWSTSSAHNEYHTRFFTYKSLSDYNGLSRFGITKACFKVIKREFYYELTNRRGGKRKLWIIHYILSKLANKFPSFENFFAYLIIKPTELRFILKKC